MLINPVLEEAVETDQDILDRGLIPVLQPAGQGRIWMDHLKQGGLVYQQLAEIAVVPADWDEVGTIMEEDVQGAGTHVFLSTGVRPDWEEYGSYHLSKEIIEGSSPWTGWIMNKKWPLNDDLGKHLLIYFQVCRGSCGGHTVCIQG